MRRVILLALLALVTAGCSGKDELPEVFPASASHGWLESEYGLDEVWSVAHPEYESEIRILLTSVPVEDLSPNYRVAFYERDGDSFSRIDNVLEFGGYRRPVLGRHPELDVPAVVTQAEAIPERTWFFVHEGKVASFDEAEEDWIPIERQ